MAVNRRDMMKIGAAAGVAATVPLARTGWAKSDAKLAASKLPKPFTLAFKRPPDLAPVGFRQQRRSDGVPYSYTLYEISQQFTVAEILPGFKTPIFGYNGITPGPTLRMQRGTPVLVRQTNALQKPPASPYQNAKMPSAYTTDPWQRSTSTHLHGSASLPQYDGYASDLTYPGQVKDYFYPNCQDARTLWYHDHGVHHTSQNAYNGLAGIYILHDEVERTLGIPTGAPGSMSAPYDVPLIMRDASFGTDGGLLYDDNSESGIYGDVMLVNGVPWPVMNVEPRIYRFRILNASVSRSYQWQLNDGRSTVPMTVIGTDAGLMPAPQVVSDFRHGMAERYEIIVDFSKYKGGTVTMKNLQPKNNIAYESMANVMQFKVGTQVTNAVGNSVPSNWGEKVPTPECLTWTDAGLKAQGVKQRQFKFIRDGGRWTINGETWENVIESNYTHCMAEPGLGDIEIWELTNTSGGWFHPVHIHLVDFQVLTRNGSTAKVLPHEKGGKDVVYVGENESVRVAMRFSGPAAGEGWNPPHGRYMMHCHNLVHEDHDMMMQFSVGDPDHLPDVDPITAAAAYAI